MSAAPRRRPLPPRPLITRAATRWRAAALATRTAAAALAPRAASAALALVAAAAMPVAGQAEADFQQGVDYRIEARLDEDSDVLTARARLRYVNRSPFTLDTLWLHQHLNAFRPNSAWATREAEVGTRTYQDLGPDEHAFERLTAITVDGAPVRPLYPGAPDSTVVALPLPRPLRTGEEVTVVLDWQARLSTVPRRQGRRGRHFDWAQWYPRVAVVDAGGWQVNPLIRAGEFNGEFATYDVTLDLAEDQVVGATGVPVSGDPGYAGAAAPGYGPPALRRDYYGEVREEALGMLEGTPAAGRKRVRFHAERVHHFGWSTSPHYTWEGGVWRDTAVAVHVLYQPGDTAWDDGVALGRTYEALEWLEWVFGAAYPWPQLTNLHRIESGGTEFPMILMDGSPSQGLIVHEGAHQYAHGILANNEWREAWLDEGMASFVTNWYWEEHGQPEIWETNLERVRALERAALSERVSQHAAEFSSYTLYSRMSYTKGSLILRALREMLGAEVFRQGLHRYYREHAFTQVTESDLKEAMEAVSGRDLDWFFEQWLHTTRRVDYAIGDVDVRRAGSGWETTVEVLRLAEGWMPVQVCVDEECRRLDGRGRRQVVTLRTSTRPGHAEVDPGDVVLDFDRGNNRRALP